MNPEDLEKQLYFLREIDALKSVSRQSYILSGERHENSAEHSWHVALLALVLAQHSEVPIDVHRTMTMMLLHDVVEVDAGDAYCYDRQARAAQKVRESEAADRLFGLLPEEQGKELRAVWDEFEARETAEAKFAAAVDRVMPLMHNYHTQGRSWKEHGTVRSQVIEHNRHIAEASLSLWDFVQQLVDMSVDKGYLAEG